MEVAMALGNIDGPIFLENYDAHIFNLKTERVSSLTRKGSKYSYFKKFVKIIFFDIRNWIKLLLIYDNINFL